MLSKEEYEPGYPHDQETDIPRDRKEYFPYLKLTYQPSQSNKFILSFKKGDLTLKINGQKVNEATGCDVIAGYIGFQSEGAEIHFRNIKLTELPGK